MNYCNSVVLVLSFLMVVVILNPFPGKSQQTEADHPAYRSPKGSMETLRTVVNDARVKKALKKRGYSDQELKYRLAVLEESLSNHQKRRLAMALTETTTKKPEGELPETRGNQFIGSTLDIVTEILLLPVKLVSWVIPGI